MKFFIQLLFFAPLFTFSQSVNIPDSIFYTTLINKNIDLNNNDSIEVSEALQVSYLNLDELNIRDLSGIEHFTNLDSLSCKWNLLSSLDVSALTSLKKLDCSYNDLTELNVDGPHSIILV